jgi:hypothetical protein
MPVLIRRSPIQDVTWPPTSFPTTCLMKRVHLYSSLYQPIDLLILSTMLPH